MRHAAELVALANENFVASFAKLAGHCDGGGQRRFGGAFAYVTQLPIALFNGCVVAEPSTPSELDEALGWVAGHDVPMTVFLAEGLDSELADVVATRGLQRDPTPYPGMVLYPIPEPPPPGHVVVEAVDATGADEFRGVFTAQGRSRDLAEAMFPESLIGDPDVHAFVGRLDGRPVGYSLAIQSERTSGVYNVGTLPEARRRGVGTALTWAAVESGRRAGLDCVVLQSSEMAVSMYQAMGFRTVVNYAVFRKPPTPTGQETPVPPSPQ
jgi:ribosomal protein S18 acetylase RimI-like enzyme